MTDEQVKIWNEFIEACSNENTPLLHPLEKTVLAADKRIAELELSEKVLFKMLREFWTNDFYPLEFAYDEKLDKAKGVLK